MKGGLVCLKVPNCHNKKDCAYYAKTNNFTYEDPGSLLTTRKIKEQDLQANISHRQ